MTVSPCLRPDQVEHVFHALQIHGQTLQPVGDLAQHRLAGERTDFLEIGELRDFHPVQPHFPAQTPGAQSRRLPVVLDKADVVLVGIDAQVRAGCRDRVPGYCREKVSAPPGTDSNAASGWGSRRNARLWGGAKVARTPRARARGRLRAGKWPYGMCPRRLRYRRVAATRSPVCPRIAEASE